MAAPLDHAFFFIDCFSSLTSASMRVHAIPITAGEVGLEEVVNSLGMRLRIAAVHFQAWDLSLISTMLSILPLACCMLSHLRLRFVSV